MASRYSKDKLLFLHTQINKLDKYKYFCSTFKIKKKLKIIICSVQELWMEAISLPPPVNTLKMLTMSTTPT